jgi:hypothetical protein
MGFQTLKLVCLPKVLMNWNHDYMAYNPYYATHFEQLSYVKEKEYIESKFLFKRKTQNFEKQMICKKEGIKSRLILKPPKK